jgi:two-component system sensor histidine kinase EvgS
VIDPSGDFDLVVEHVRDVTERKLAEEARRDSEEQFKVMFETVSIGMTQSDPRTRRWLRVNRKMCEITGYSLDEMLSKGVTEITHPEDLERESETFQNVISGKSNDYRLENRYIRKDGTTVWVNVNMTLIRDLNGQPVRTMATIEDITDRKRAEEEKARLQDQLLQAQKMESIGRLAGGVAHDFNNMLGVIIGRAEMALQQDVPTDKLRRNLHEILKAGLRSAELTRQLLAFARKQIAVPKILDLNDTISSMLKMLRRLIGEDIELLWAPELDLWKVKMDPSQVDQILANLAVNSRDAISGVGAITMRTENVAIDDSIRAETPEFIPGEYVLLTVSDTGAGMSKEVCENIFEPFFTTKEVGKGTGLGLSTVYGIVKQNDGFVYVASEPGKGTTFKIYLPRLEVQTAQAPSEDAAGKHPTGTETILLVEDDEAILNLSRVILENLGYTVIAASAPEQAINLVEDHPGDIHLLITDVVMPGMNGRELAERLCAIRPNLKRLYMSGYTADLIAHRGILDAGVNFIQKPFGSDELAARVREVLDQLE